MKQQYFVVVLAHSLHGRLRRVHIPHQAIYIVLILAIFGGISVLGLASSYARMAWKVANYNHLRDEIQSLRHRYEVLQKVTQEKNQQLATLQLFASEISVAYGIRQKIDSTPSVQQASTLVPSYRDSLAEYNYLRTASLSRNFRRFPYRWQTQTRPSLWPVDGLLMSHFGARSDPFNGEGAFHTGIDISAPRGTPVRVTADGVVEEAGYSGPYGKLVVVDHGNGLYTYYAHLSRLDVVPGQEVRRGEIIGGAGSTGRATGSHVHYEVRLNGTPVNPYPFLRSTGTSAAVKNVSFLQ
jgi:murein DD-endopeptidase MepM/ murein hydrolase activator NlpD